MSHKVTKSLMSLILIMVLSNLTYSVDAQIALGASYSTQKQNQNNRRLPVYSFESTFEYFEKLDTRFTFGYIPTTLVDIETEIILDKEIVSNVKLTQFQYSFGGNSYVYRKKNIPSELYITGDILISRTRFSYSVKTFDSGEDSFRTNEKKETDWILMAGLFYKYNIGDFAPFIGAQFGYRIISSTVFDGSAKFGSRTRNNIKIGFTYTITDLKY